MNKVSPWDLAISRLSVIFERANDMDKKLGKRREWLGNGKGELFSRSFVLIWKSFAYVCRMNKRRYHRMKSLKLEIS